MCSQLLWDLQWTYPRNWSWGKRYICAENFPAFENPQVGAIPTQLKETAGGDAKDHGQRGCLLCTSDALHIYLQVHYTMLYLNKIMFTWMHISTFTHNFIQSTSFVKVFCQTNLRISKDFAIFFIGYLLCTLYSTKLRSY